MKKLVSITITVCFIITAASAYGHGVARKPEVADEGRMIQFPDTENYKTIVLDPHTHSAFSDGHVWPGIRVAEALRDGLDAIAITEHLEYQPHLADIPHPDRNRAYEIAVAANGENDLIVIAGSEITRQAPAGHINALFLSDANKLVKKFTPSDPNDVRGYYEGVTKWPAQAAVEAANEQDAFVFWNHAWWGADFPNGIPVAPKFHIDNAKKKLLHGIEIANGSSYSEEAFQIALDLKLTLIGVSDIHGLIDWDYKPHQGGHRPVTLVLAAERSEESIREALFAGRTIVWFKNLLIAREKPMNELLAASLHISSASYTGNSEILVLDIENNSDSDFQLMNNSKYTFTGGADILAIGQHDTTRIGVKTGKRIKKIKLKFDVLNALVEPKKHAKLTLSAKTVELE